MRSTRGPKLPLLQRPQDEARVPEAAGKREGQRFESFNHRTNLFETIYGSYRNHMDPGAILPADFDGDGLVDLYVIRSGKLRNPEAGWIDEEPLREAGNQLLRNRGNGRFEDVTRRAGLPTGGTRWGSGCTFLDYDRDGRADLFIANYLRFDLASAPEIGKGPNCVWKGVPVNCGPRGLPTDTNLLFHNKRDGTFSDVSARSAVAQVTGRYAMTATATDFPPTISPGPRSRTSGSSPRETQATRRSPAGARRAR